MNTHNQQAAQSGPRLRIGDLAQAGGASTKTIRYYEEVGLLPPARRAENGYRLYDYEDIQRLRFIRNARSLEFSLDDLKEVLALRDQGEAPCRYVVQLLAEKVVGIEERIGQLRELQQHLQQLLQQATSLPDDDIEMKECVCHLIYNREH